MHVEYLARELAPLVDLTVHCQGADRPTAVAHRPAPGLRDAVLRTFSADLSMADAVAGTDLVHSHTWYANLAGHLASLRYGIPHVMTMHSLEPLRPWKAEQLGGGYALSSWAEKVAATSAAAVVAVSEGMRADVRAAYPDIPAERIRVIRNGIDTTEYAPDAGTDVLVKHGIDTVAAVRDLRGPDDPAEGASGPAARGGRAGRVRAAGAVRRRAGHPGAAPPRSPAWSPGCRRPGPA